MNEHLQKHTPKIKDLNNREFGYVFSFIFFLIAIFPLLYSSHIRFWMLFFSFILFFLTIFNAKSLTYFNRKWSRFGFFLHSIMNPILLGILFFFFVTPIGFIIRLLGKDPLQLKFNRDIDSYWIKRNENDNDSFKNQF